MAVTLVETKSQRIDSKVWQFNWSFRPAHARCFALCAINSGPHARSSSQSHPITRARGEGEVGERSWPIYSFPADYTSSPAPGLKGEQTAS